MKDLARTTLVSLGLTGARTRLGRAGVGSTGTGPVAVAPIGADVVPREWSAG